MLKKNRLKTIGDIVAKIPEVYNAHVVDAFMNNLKLLETEPFDIHFDFSHRTAIHDCLDFRNIEKSTEFRETLIRHGLDCFFESKLMPQILTGIFGLSVEAEVQIPEMSQFLNDVGEEELQTMFSEITRDEAFKENLPQLQDDDYRLSVIKQQGKLKLGEQEMRRIAYRDLKNPHDVGDFKVRHFISDWSQTFIQSKLQVFLNDLDVMLESNAVRHKDREVVFDLFKTQEGFCKSPYEVALLTNRLNELYGDEIENQTCMKYFIDS